MKHDVNQPKIRERQTEILLLLYRFRFLNRAQIQKMLGHKNHRLVIEWLNDLVEKGYIDCRFDKKLAASPTIYFLATASRKLLIDQLEIEPNLLNRIWREKNYSEEFRTHCLFVADIYLSLFNLENVKAGRLHFKTRTDLYGDDRFLVPAPDAYFIIRGKNKQKTCSMLELLDDLPPSIIRKRIRSYFDYYDSDEWQERTHKAFPLIILVCPSKRIKSHLNYYIQSKLDEDSDLKVYLTTWDLIKEKGLHNSILERVVPEE